MNIGGIGYAVAALAYFILAFLLLAPRRLVVEGRVLAAAAVLTGVWCALNAWFPSTPGLLPALGLFNSLRYAAWFYALRRLIGPALPGWLFFAGLGTCAIHLVGKWALPALPSGFAGHMVLQSVFGHTDLVLALLGLVLIEQFSRAAEPTHSGSAHFLAIGIGGQFAYDLFLFAQAELLGGLSGTAWSLRGVLLAALVPVAAFGVKQFAGSRSALFVSRHVVFYSSAVFVVGLYLLAMAVGGYYVRFLDAQWGPALQAAFLLGAALVLASVLVGGTAWRRLKVFVATHFYRNKYDYRVEWLRFVRTLSGPETESFGITAIRAAAQVMGCPGGILLLKDGAGFELDSCWPETRRTSLPNIGPEATDSLVAFFQERQWVVDVDEWIESPRNYGGLELPQWLASKAAGRIAVPLMTNDCLDGILCLDSPPPPFRMNFEDIDLLHTMGSHIAVHLRQQRADQRLSESRQFDAYNRLSAFVMHDLKNSVAQLQLLISNASRHRRNPVFVDDAIDTIANSVERMTRLIEQIRSPDIPPLIRPTDIAGVLKASVARTSVRQPAPKLTVRASGLNVMADIDRLGNILDHVVRNAQDAAGEAGCVGIELDCEGSSALITVIDDGQGMEEAFVQERLFRPFDSTKGARGMGIGAYQVREYVRSVGGEVKVQSAPGRGTRFSIRLALCPNPNQNPGS